MANNAGKTPAGLLVGLVAGAALGYVLGTDKDKRNDQIDKLKSTVNKLKSRLGKKAADIEDEIYNN